MVLPAHLMQRRFFWAMAASIGLWAWLLPIISSPAAELKNYQIQSVNGVDILCEPYTVRPNDWVSRLLTRRGQISRQDFPQFLSIFKALNPHIDDVDRILPGETLLIPLKKLNPDALPGQASGVVSIPLITISRVPPKPREQAAPSHAFQRLSVLEFAARVLGGQLVDRGSYYLPRTGQLPFQLNLGQTPLIRLAGGRMVWVDLANQLSTDLERAITAFWKHAVVARPAFPSDPEQILAAVFSTSGALAANSRRQIFGQGMVVDFQARWLVNHSDARKRWQTAVFLRTDQHTAIDDALKHYLRRHRLTVVDAWLSEGTVIQQPAASPSSRPVVAPVLDALAPKIWVPRICNVLGVKYESGVLVSFPYAGLQLQVQSNMITRPGRLPLLVDFGEIYGDAIGAIEQTGIEILQIPDAAPFADTLQRLSLALDLPTTIDPRFYVIPPTDHQQFTVKVSGMLITGRKLNSGRPSTPSAKLADRPLLLLKPAPAPDIVRFLRQRPLELMVVR